MAGVLDTVNQRTQLVGENRLELLLFKMSGKQVYGINVFKVREVLPCPGLTVLPNSHPVVKGVAHIRSHTIPIVDLNMATGKKSLGDPKDLFVIITEYNGRTQGFLVKNVERIINMNWSDIQPPPKGTGRDHYLTAVAEVEDKLVEIIDVEKVLAEVSPQVEEISEEILEEASAAVTVDEEAEVENERLKIANHILIVDDSRIARKQVQKCLEALGCVVTALNDGKEALEHLKDIVEDGSSISDHYSMMISDIEMPEMDGYTLVTEVRNDTRMTGFHVVLHTSLSGVFNKAMVDKVGANDFIAKFNPDVLASKVSEQIARFKEQNS